MGTLRLSASALNRASRLPPMEAIERLNGRGDAEALREKGDYYYYLSLL